jgi:hypothetical protein
MSRTTVQIIKVKKYADNSEKQCSLYETDNSTDCDSSFFLVYYLMILYYISLP